VGSDDATTVTSAGSDDATTVTSAGSDDATTVAAMDDSDATTTAASMDSDATTIAASMDSDDATTAASVISNETTTADSDADTAVEMSTSVNTVDDEAATTASELAIDTIANSNDDTEYSSTQITESNAGMTTVSPTWMDSTTDGLGEDESRTGTPDILNLTPVTVLSILESDDSTLVVTTARPDILYDDTDEATTVSAEEEGVHEFDCVEIDQEKLDTSSDQIPMECTGMDGEEMRRVFIVINKSQVDPEKLFAKNVKVLVKDFMIMDVSNSSQAR
jgi:hypothetical protein